MLHTGSGRIVYDPKRPGMKRSTDWWCILQVDREITRYYRWWVWRRHGIELCQPSWDAHISIVRGEKPRGEARRAWRRHQGRILTFTYSHEVRQGWDPRTGAPQPFWILEVECPEMRAIRDELGLATRYPFHLTIGRVYEETRDAA